MSIFEANELKAVMDRRCAVRDRKSFTNYADELINLIDIELRKLHESKEILYEKTFNIIINYQKLYDGFYETHKSDFKVGDTYNTQLRSYVISVQLENLFGYMIQKFQAAGYKVKEPDIKMKQSGFNFHKITLNWNAVPKLEEVRKEIKQETNREYNETVYTTNNYTESNPIFAATLGAVVGYSMLDDSSCDCDLT